MHPTPPQSKSQAEIAAHLSKALEFPVTRDQVRWWAKRGYDLDDPAQLRHQLLNSERPPKGLRRNTQLVESLTPEEAAARMQRSLLCTIVSFIAEIDPDTPHDEIVGGLAFACIDGHRTTYGDDESELLTKDIAAAINPKRKG